MGSLIGTSIACRCCHVCVATLHHEDSYNLGPLKTTNEGIDARLYPRNLILWIVLEPPTSISNATIPTIPTIPSLSFEHLSQVNCHHRNDPSSPWGGFGQSGIGRENGPEAFEEYTTTKSLTIRTALASADKAFQLNATTLPMANLHVSCAVGG